MITTIEFKYGFIYKGVRYTLGKIKNYSDYLLKEIKEHLV